MKLDNLPGHREAEPGALTDRFGGEERLEKLGLVSGRNTGACVVNFGNELRLANPGPQDELAAFGGRLAGIHEYVDQNLLHFVAIE